MNICKQQSVPQKVEYFILKPIKRAGSFASDNSHYYSQT